MAKFDQIWSEFHASSTKFDRVGPLLRPNLASIDQRRQHWLATGKSRSALVNVAHLWSHLAQLGQLLTKSDRGWPQFRPISRKVGQCRAKTFGLDLAQNGPPMTPFLKFCFEKTTKKQGSPAQKLAGAKLKPEQRQPSNRGPIRSAQLARQSKEGGVDTFSPSAAATPRWPWETIPATSARPETAAQLGVPPLRIATVGKRPLGPCQRNGDLARPTRRGARRRATRPSNPKGISCPAAGPTTRSVPTRAAKRLCRQTPRGQSKRLRPRRCRWSPVHLLQKLGLD